ncbi:MAG: imidazolonepropionase, partial [Thermoplasmata archaeon]
MAEVDILIKNANEVIVLKDNGRPRRGKEMRELDIIKGGYVAMKDGRIFDVGKSCKMKGDVEIDARNKIVLPGFVDCHTHLAFSGYRDFELEMKLRGLSYQEIAAAGG